MVGKRIAHYEVLDEIGAGGMGVVYKARDTRLERNAAIKALPEELAEDPERLARFEREAKLLASLNNPYIATVYGLEEVESRRFLAMELIEGENLAERLSKGPIPVQKALELARQIAEALEAAHEAGVIHRDVKPGNIMIDEDGKAKVLDFGLAKELRTDTPEADLSHSPTLPQPMTTAGQVLGTPVYMSPEQVEGKAGDKQSDIWALGCVLYEMFAGKRAFPTLGLGDAEREPDWEALPVQIPPGCVQLVRRLLEKNPKNRIHDMADARILLEDALSGPRRADPPTAESPGRLTAAVVVAALVGLGAFLAGGLLLDLGSRAPIAVSSRFSHGLPTEAPLALDLGAPLGFDMALFDISSDGTRLVYVADTGATTQLYVATIGEFGATPLDGTEGAANPFFSPDDNWVGYISSQEIRKIPLGGGRPETVAEVGGAIWGAAWSGGDIYVLDGIGRTLRRAPASGGTAVEAGHVAGLGYAFLGNLSALPDGRGLLARAAHLSPTSSDYSDVVVYSTASQEWKTVLEGAGYNARYAPSGHLVYARGGGLWVVGFDLDRLEAIGEPTLVLENLRVDSVIGHAQFALSDNGTLVFVSGGDRGVAVPTWIDRSGRAEAIPNISPHLYGAFALSPDGRWLAVQVAGPADHVWIYDVATGEGSRLTSKGSNGWPAWSPDGKRISYSSRRGDGWGLYARRIDGSGEARELLRADHPLLAQSWSPANVLAYNEFDRSETGALLAIDEATTTSLLYPKEAVEWGHRFSRNGRWIAYASARDGQFEVWLRPFPELQPEMKVSLGEGMEAIWSADGRRLYYRDRNQWTVREIDPEVGITSVLPGPVLETSFVDTRAVSWDLGPDERLLVLKPIQDDANPTEIRLALNWFDELNRILPAD